MDSAEDGAPALMKLITTFPLEHYEISTFDAGFAFAISLILNGVEATVSKSTRKHLVAEGA